MRCSLRSAKSGMGKLGSLDLADYRILSEPTQRRFEAHFLWPEAGRLLVPPFPAIRVPTPVKRAVNAFSCGAFKWNLRCAHGHFCRLHPKCAPAPKLTNRFQNGQSVPNRALQPRFCPSTSRVSMHGTHYLRARSGPSRYERDGPQKVDFSYYAEVGIAYTGWSRQLCWAFQPKKHSILAQSNADWKSPKSAAKFAPCP
jgi:hypothetical protein